MRFDGKVFSQNGVKCKWNAARNHVTLHLQMAMNFICEYFCARHEELMIAIVR